ncbi:MAG: heavy metal translocating P-type ATPase [Acidobacteriota bacterium]
MTTADLAAPASGCTRCAIHAESVFRVDGLCCGEEATVLERRIRPLDGVEDLRADIVGQRLHVSYDAALVSVNTIVEAVAATGMRAQLEHEEPVVTPASRARGVLVFVAGLALAAGLAAQVAGAPAAWSIAAHVTAALVGGVFPARRAYGALRTRTLDINVLMLIAVGGAMLLQEWAEAGTVVFLFAIAQWLEARSMDRARDAIGALMELTPSQVRIREADREHVVPVARVPIGALMLVRPGEKIALDGRVTAGCSEVNQAPITGESIPVDKATGDTVFAGTINGRGALDVIVTKRRADTTLARIIQMVETAQAQRAPSQQFIDRFSRWYTPGVVGLAVVVATVPPLLFGQFDVWFYRALVLLVVSCPCALVISTPVSIVSALAGAARRGVLIKGGIHLERLAAVRAMAFDKTGTLTLAAVRVTHVTALNGATDDTLLSAAAAVERRSEHPVAAAIVDEAARRGLAVEPARDVRALAGLGAEGVVNSDEVVCGNARLFVERGLWSPPIEAAAARLTALGASPVLVARAGVVLGVIGVADEPREVAADAVASLHRLGIAPVVMLTGDQEAVARRVGQRLGLDEVRAGLLPEDKVAAVRDLRQRGSVVAMVGDGVNDAPALAVADVGIVMGAIGSDAALETADVALMADELPKLAYAVRLSRATVWNIRANIAMSLVLKAAFLALAVGGLATLWMAVVADTGTSLLVVANAMRLLRYE